MTKPGYTLEQHQQLGKDLYAISERLSAIRSELSGAYPQAVYKHAVKAHEAIKELRSALDSCVHEENQGIGFIRCYYLGGSPGPEQ